MRRKDEERGEEGGREKEEEGRGGEGEVRGGEGRGVEVR